MKGADLLVSALENEGVKQIFWIAVPVDYSENTRVLVDELRAHATMEGRQS
jgi:hypothetical protein